MTKTTVYYNGLIVWRPPCIYKSSCAIDVEYFPYDAQTCFLKMGSWTYSGFQVRPMVLLRFFWPLNLGYLGFLSHFPKTVCPCRFIFAVCLALFDSTILLYEYQSHQVELFLCDYLYNMAKTLDLFWLNSFINHLNPELLRNSFNITFEKNKSFELM